MFSFLLFIRASATSFYRILILDQNNKILILILLIVKRNQSSKCQHLLDHQRATEFRENIHFCFTDDAKAFDVWITVTCGKFFKRWEYQTTWPASSETRMQVTKQQLELDTEQQTGSK